MEKAVTETIWHFTEEARLVDTFESLGVDTENNIVATFYYEVKEGTSLQIAAEHIAAEQSTGTWTPVEHETPEVRQKYGGKVFRLFASPDNPNAAIADIAFPAENYDPEIGGLPNLLSCVAGNIYGMADFKNIRLLDFHLPKNWLNAFKGPKFGLEGVRKIVGTDIDRRPHLGTIVKPNFGIECKTHAKIVYEAASGGCDFVKDDELLVNPPYNRLEDRVVACSEALDTAREETGRQSMYALNITSPAHKILEVAEKVQRNAGKGVLLMVDFVWAGLSAVQALAEDPSIKLPIHCHRAGHAAFTRSRTHGMTLLALSKLVRIAGGDQLHTGTAAGKMHGSITEAQAINRALKRSWLHLKPVMPVASGGVHPGNLHWNIAFLGLDLTVNMGGGIHGHPDGAKAGAKAAREALNFILKGVKLEDGAKESIELRKALEKWRILQIPEELRTHVIWWPPEGR
ncbi:MAG: RuBisCO large subunit C-terminal-like domain-containing protein [Candidatus Bathyarchaeia archaeon]